MSKKLRNKYTNHLLYYLVNILLKTNIRVNKSEVFIPLTLNLFSFLNFNNILKINISIIVNE